MQRGNGGRGKGGSDGRGVGGRYRRVRGRGIMGKQCIQASMSPDRDPR